jgi:hypothetical protein
MLGVGLGLVRAHHSKPMKQYKQAILLIKLPMYLGSSLKAIGQLLILKHLRALTSHELNIENLDVFDDLSNSPLLGRIPSSSLGHR